LGCSTFKEGPDRLCRTACDYQLMLRDIPEEQRPVKYELIYQPDAVEYLFV
jgi:hypothetical protein